MYDVLHSELLVDASIIAVRRDRIATPTGEADREIVEHFSAVAIAALRTRTVPCDASAGSLNKASEILLVRQYRHGVGKYLWEIPAGLLDKVGEEPLAAARRELAEEAGLAAQQWYLLGDVVNSPGYSEEKCRIYAATDLQGIDAALAATMDEQCDEEADLERRWVPLEEAIQWVQDGRIENSICVAAILHLAVGTYREVNEPFEYHSSLAQRRCAAHPEGAEPGMDMKNMMSYG